MKKIISLVLIAASLLLMSSCGDDGGLGELGELATTAKHTQVFTDGNEVGTTAAPVSNPTAAVTSVQNNSWTANYSLTYSINENGETSVLKEQRCDGIYCVTDTASGAISYFEQNGEDIDQYILNPSAKTGTHSLLENSSLADITTGFMKIAAVNPEFTTYSNVEYQGEETVAGRSAKKYTQSAYSDAGLLTAYAFVWLDSEYGFASKCKVYNLTGTVNTSWELTEFSVGGVSADGIGFSTDGYEITEEDTAE